MAAVPSTARRTLSTAEVARILRLPEARVRRIVRAGLCRPARRGRAYAFGFQDVVVLRAAKELLDRQVPLARVRRAMAALARALPPDRPLSGLRIRADGRQVVVTEGGATWRPEDGQLLLDFALDPMAERVAALTREPTGAGGEAARRGAPGGPRTGSADAAQAAFREALALEDDAPEAAAEAYRRALAEDPELLDAWVNLGRLVHEGGDAREAVQLYHRALAIAPDDPVAHYNVALALEDAKGPEPAIAHYERAIALDPGFADAHYNLAGLYEQLGRGADALRHYRAYKKLTEA
ncbi:MAG: tetratricopeptide repeat protein [Myxococcota bacterium]|nr:tetratricopeptide repeat protein [Myxococcota bacterium]